MSLMFSPLKVERIYIVVGTFNIYQSQIFFVSQKLMIDECVRIKTPANFHQQGPALVTTPRRDMY